MEHQTIDLMYLALRYAYYDEKRIHTLPKLKKCPRENKPLNIIDKKEIRQLLAVAKDTEWYLEYLLALFLGLRKGEIRGLKFSDFDVDAHTVNIQRQLNHHSKFIDGSCEKVDSVLLLILLYQRLIAKRRIKILARLSLM